MNVEEEKSDYFRAVPEVRKYIDDTSKFKNIKTIKINFSVKLDIVTLRCFVGRAISTFHNTGNQLFIPVKIYGNFICTVK